MMLFEFLEMFLLPSVFIFVLLSVGIIFILFERRKIGKILLILGASFYYLFSITPISDFLISPLENQYRHPAEEEIEKINTIVVLSGGLSNRRLSLPSALGESTLFRLNEALKAYFSKKQKPKIIISGTSPLEKFEKESLYGAKFLELFEIPKEKIAFEVQSGDTFQHAKEIKKMVDKEPFLLITSAYHMPRAMETFKRVGLVPTALPTDYRFEGNYNILDFLPQGENLKKSNLALHEYFGILFYRFFIF